MDGGDEDEPKDGRLKAKLDPRFRDGGEVDRHVVLG